jgi:hypothetical protein
MAQYRKDLQIIDDSPQRYEMIMLADKWGNQIDDSKSTINDAFGRTRISTPFTLFDSQHRYTLNDKYSTHVKSSLGATGIFGSTGLGTSYINHSPNESTVEMHIGTGSGDYVIRESNLVFPYQPGKSLLCLESFTFNTPKLGLRQRIGYFNSQNGVYFENDGVTNYIVLRSYSGLAGSVGTVSEIRIPQEEWNVDKFDGSGASLVSLANKANILFIDIEWLGVGDVRVGFIINGSMRVAHIFYNANVNNTTYMTTACLPTRHEIENYSVTDSSSMTRQICNTVISEGGYDLIGTSYSVTRGFPSYQTLGNAGSFSPSISIKLNANYLDQIAKLSEFAVLLESNTNMQYKLIMNATINSTSWIPSTSGRIDYNIDATTISGGRELLSGFISSGNVVSLGNANIQLGRTLSDSVRSIVGVSDVLTVAVAAFSNSTKVASLLGWSELI